MTTSPQHDSHEWEYSLRALHRWDDIELFPIDRNRLYEAARDGDPLIDGAVGWVDDVEDLDQIMAQFGLTDVFHSSDFADTEGFEDDDGPEDYNWLDLNSSYLPLMAW